MARRHAACGRNRRAARAQRKSCRNRRAVGTYSNIEPWRAESHDAQTANRSCSNGQRLACPSRCRRAPRLLHIRSSTCLSCRHHNACISLHHAVLPVLVHRDAVILCIARPRAILPRSCSQTPKPMLLPGSPAAYTRVPGMALPAARRSIRSEAALSLTPLGLAHCQCRPCRWCAPATPDRHGSRPAHHLHARLSFWTNAAGRRNPAASFTLVLPGSSAHARA